jgi:thymidylate synthase (FAD)
LKPLFWVISEGDLSKAVLQAKTTPNKVQESIKQALKDMNTTIPVLDHGFVRYIDHMGTDTRIVESARISYGSPSKGEEQDKKLLRYLWKNHHTSPFEQCQIQFNIRMPIFVMRQFVRHRMQSLNEVSARYTVLPDVFYIPTSWRKQDTKNKQGSISEDDWDSTELIKMYAARGRALTKNEMLTEELQKVSKASYDCYERMLAEGVAREMARMVLPVNIYTEIYTTWDLNNLLKFFRLRDDNHAQWEHAQFAQAMKQITKLHFPWVMEIYEESLKS